MRQIPQASKTTITIYSYWKNPLAEQAAYTRKVIHNAHCEPMASESKDNRGSSVALDMELFIYDMEGFLPFAEFRKISLLMIDLAGYWTLNPGTPTLRDQTYVLTGDADFTFTPGTLAHITEQENALKKSYPYDNYRVGGIRSYGVGSPRMNHIEAGLKRTV